jgi:hypothetical protein
MAPGDVAGFGMDEGRASAIATYIIVGARDTQAPAKDNSEFAVRFIPHLQLDVLLGLVDHEIFVNECDALGHETWPESCIDAPRHRSKQAARPYREHRLEILLGVPGGARSSWVRFASHNPPFAAR